MGRRRSATSSAATKRSHDCGSASPSKKMAAGQKTLGVAWGASSKSASSARYSSPFSDFSSYMEIKNRKLRDQFDADSSTSAPPASSSSSLFRGISIFVDGFTLPSNQELKSYMLNYGGRFENYFSRHWVTHIICSNLPDSKLKNLRSFSGGLPVVEPAWILDCVAANRILSWHPYQLNQITSKTSNQRKLSDLYALKSGSKSQDTSEDGESSTSDGSEKTSDFLTREKLKENGTTVYNSEEFILNECMDNDEEKMAVMLSNQHEKEEQASESASMLNAEKISISKSPSSLDNMLNGEEGEVKAFSPSSNSYSISRDHNFVENYFKKSRLHFIGTWRNRYRKRFPAKVESKCSYRTDSGPRSTYIMHIDMDSFFVSVVTRNRPELLNAPVAVCHSDNPNGTAEISSANYPARGFGIRAGMFVKDAKSLCSNLVIVPYNFEAYEEVADQFYEILHTYCNKVQAISCDEAFLDLSGIDGDDPQYTASKIREEIFRTTRCTASAGIGSNMLIARLATKKAKPNGLCYIPAHEVDDYMNNLPIKSLPGIGHSLSSKLFSRNIETCAQLRAISKEILQKDFGSKTGEMLWNYTRGIDNREVGSHQEVKSIGAEVNWGVRFNATKEAQDFLVHLSNEVSLRLQSSAMIGRTITLKVKRRRKGAEEPIKYMGCGDCDNLSHSITIPTATDDTDVLQKISKQLFASFHVDNKEVRGVGLQVSRLESADCRNQGRQKNSIRSWLASGSKNVGMLREDPGHAGQNSSGTGQTSSVSLSNNISWPAIREVDMNVIDSLPPEIVSEINAVYGGELTRLMNKTEDNDVKLNDTSSKKQKIEESFVVERKEEKQPICSPAFPNGARTNVEVGESSHAVNEEDICYQSATDVNMICGASKCDLLPSSLSQVDHSVLQELPSDIRANLLESLPPHRLSKCPEKGGEGLNSCRDSVIYENPISTGNLWSEQPPRWIKKFENSTCSLILNVLAEVYLLGHDDLLSTALQKMNSHVSCIVDFSSNEYQEAAIYFCELLKDYIHLKIDSDIEEIYLCFRVLNRSARKTNFLQRVYDMIVPSLQVLYIFDSLGMHGSTSSSSSYITRQNEQEKQTEPYLTVRPSHFATRSRSISKYASHG